ncbi:class I SAM-dependent methyltransferase [Oceanicoccus sp. KOV_DT_Chl]|uniref:class I SAM-dependent methyltransferase n=1 Tax=Oceanicoccus sp. KOV_DT_Chl TaxID=1904639 RepID=UPI000C7DA6E9|nr:class I SAM-dependent methyltransferase [Oceanicoccus sp. KOV_DT_Chl]
MTNSNSISRALATRSKWDKAAPTFDLMAGEGAEKRWKPDKLKLFSRMGEGNILFMALGTGLDIACFPPHRHINAIDISPEMLKHARPRAEQYNGDIDIAVMDVHELEFEDNYFDQIFTSCSFCSVPDPIEGLQSLKRVLKPGGELLMFEHTGSAFFPFNFMLNIMTPLSSKVGPDMNRPTVDNVRKAGFTIIEVNNIFLDVVKTIRAHKN